MRANPLRDTIERSKFREVIYAARDQIVGEINPFTTAYRTDGGTYVIASAPKWNDDRKPHDLVAILPAPLEGTRVLPLRPTVDPDLIDALRGDLDA